MISLSRTVAAFLLDCVFPHLCLGCGSVLTVRDQDLCITCFSAIRVLSPHLCAACGRSFITITSCAGGCSFPVFAALPYANRIASSLIQQLKYRHVPRAADMLGFLMFFTYITVFGVRPLDAIIVPMPIYWVRRYTRGYNQAEKIAHAFSRRVGISILSSSMLRIRHTRAQTSLSSEKRAENVQNAFAIINPTALRGKTVFLLDDVYTTGATLHAAATCLKHAGARHVIGLVAARA